MTKEKLTELLNSFARNQPVDIKDIVNLISDYLTDINYENSDKLISFISNNPILTSEALPTVIDYFRRKYTIYSVIYNNKTILYYVTD